MGAGLVTLMGLQGFFAARPYLAHFKTLSGGDDWLGFESRARDVLQNGLLMTLGRPVGEGDAYFYHPFYSYVLAGVHAVAGESLFGPIFMQFLVLAITGFLMWSFARSVFGTVPAMCGLAALLVVFEVDFIRYYTVTLLSENIYILFVTLCLRAFATWAESGATRTLIQAGMLGRPVGRDQARDDDVFCAGPGGHRGHCGAAPDAGVVSALGDDRRGQLARGRCALHAAQLDRVAQTGVDFRQPR